MLVNEFSEDLLVSLTPFLVQDKVKSGEESSRNLLLFFPTYAKFDHSTPGMERFDNFILVIAGKDESTVTRIFFNRGPKEQLYIWCGVICLVDDNDFMFGITG